MKFETIIDDTSLEVDIAPEEHTFTLNDKTHDYKFKRQPNGRYLLRTGTHLYKIDNVEIEHNLVTFSLNGNWHQVEVRDEQDMLMDEMGFKTASDVGEGQLKAPMPGKILELMVKEGDEVMLGDPVAILEAMKMENELKAPMTGVIAHISAVENDSLEKNALILEIEARG